jgi:phospho-N-acetylmuramoyl-pentapeptide-transferase
MDSFAPPLISALIPAAAAFAIGLAITPIVTHYLYLHKAWKKSAGKKALDGSAARVFNNLHKHHEVRAPRMGGVVIWVSVLITIILFRALSIVWPTSFTFALDFLSRGQTWIPHAALIIGALVGLIDDILTVGERGEGLRLRARLAIVVVLSTYIGWWFYAKLGFIAINVPFAEPLILGWLIVPLFILVSLAVYASGVIDGIDGLSGGVFAPIFAAYAVIAFAQQQSDVAAFCASIVGALLAFLWFNIPPARFYMSDTGTMGLTLTLAAVAFLTDSPGGGVGISVLPIVGFVLVATVASNMLQVFWKRVFGRKLLRVAPLHHHFEAIGWPGYKVAMRYWVVSSMSAFVGVIIALATLA